MIGSARFWETVLGGTTAAAVRRPRTTVALALALCLGAAALVATRLELRSSNLDLIDPALPEVARFRAFAEAFGTPNLLVVVLEGDDAVALSDAAERIAPVLRPLPGVRAVRARLPFRDEILVPLGVDPYFRSNDGGMLYLFVQPDDADSAAVTIAPFVEGVERAIGALGLDASVVRVGYTGLPRYALDDRDLIQGDIARLSGISLVAILLLFAWGFRGFREPLCAIAVLGAAALVTGGVAALVPGYLTLVSAFFFSILFGLGIDFGVHVVDRAEELRAEGLAEPEALVAAVRLLAPGLGTGASTTALSFFVLIFSGFRGFAQLGGLAGLGVLLALLGMVTLLPALLVLVPSRRTVRRAGERGTGRLLHGLARPSVAMALLALVVASIAIGPPAFDGDYLNLQAEGSEAVRLERAMVARSEGAAQFAAFVARDADAARELAERLRREPTVGAVHALADHEPLLVLGAEIPGEWESFRRMYVDNLGRHAVYAFPRGDVWEPEFQARFLAAMRAVDPEATGMPMLGRFLVERSQRALWITGSLSALLLVALVFADLASPLRATLAVAPTFGALALMLGGMKLLGVDFNPLNLLALPIVIGVAEDSGVHLVHRFLLEGGDLARTLAGAGRTVALCGATTLIGFGALVFAHHRGLASFAIALALGVGAALVLSLAVLPQLLRWAAPRLLASQSTNGRRALRASIVALALLVPTSPASAAPDGLAVATGAPEADSVVRAENCWAERGRGFAASGRVDPAPVLCAIEAWELALRARPERLDLAFREIEALWFAAHFADRFVPALGSGLDARREAWLERAVELAEASTAEVERRAGARPRRDEVRALSAAELAHVPEAGEAEFWRTIAWGEWTIARGSFAALRRGAIDRMHEAAERAAQLAPDLRDGGGLRLLGRIHSTAPRVPLVSGWVDRERGLRLLESALARSRRDPRNLLFLAEALLERVPARRGEAIALLRELALRRPDPQAIVEESETLALARERLRQVEREQEGR